MIGPWHGWLTIVLQCYCWLGHVTRKTVSEMTYNVSSGTLNSTIPYLGSAACSPADPGGARPPNAFFCISQINVGLLWWHIMIVVTYLLRQSITLYKNLGGLEPLSPIASAATAWSTTTSLSIAYLNLDIGLQIFQIRSDGEQMQMFIVQNKPLHTVKCKFSL